MLNEELNKMKYLFGYQKGVVISEQAVPPPPPTTGTTGAIPPPPVDPTAGTIPPPPADVTTQTTTVPQKVDIEKLRDCASYKSGGKLTKGEEKDDFTIFNNEKGIAVCKKPKE